MNGIRPEDIAKARPLDDILQECEEAAASDFHRLPAEQRDGWYKLAEASRDRWRSMFAFRGQSQLHQIRVRTPSHGVVPWISLHASGYRFVHELDWTVRWWPDDHGDPLTEARTLYDSIRAKVTEFDNRLSRWRDHLWQHRLTRELAERLFDDAMRHFREDTRLQELFPNILLPPEELLELHRGFAKLLQWAEAFFGSLGQHYGIRSKYLDLTYSPRVAARFALEANWQRVLNGERVYGYIMSFILPMLFLHVQKFKQQWAPPYPTIVDISWIPTTIAKRPAVQQGLSLSNSPSPLYSTYIVTSGSAGYTPFYTVSCRELEDIVKMDLMPGADPFLEVVQEFLAADERATQPRG